MNSYLKEIQAMKESGQLKRNVLSESEMSNLNQEIMDNVLLFIQTGAEKYHGLAVKLIKYRDGLTGKAANKIFWIIRNTLAKKNEAQTEEASND